ncbi:hypothetical protein NG791_03980 [Laspinema sp. D1]|uniref:hypothetical protein n=1 Tax=Laspinema palackyanum TaxID=3231601 RepID=UPI003499F7B5|nr:hypothetical protein [Laspinema sp. D2b]
MKACRKAYRHEPLGYFTAIFKGKSGQPTGTGLNRLPAIAIFSQGSSQVSGKLDLSCTPISSMAHRILLTQIPKKPKCLKFPQTNGAIACRKDAFFMG